MLLYGRVVTELSRLTGLTFINTPVNSNKPIERSVRRVLFHHNKQEYEVRDLLLGKLILLVKNLQEIEKYNLELFNKFKKLLLKSINENEYFGARFEISFAASMIRKGIAFKKRESPDFRIGSENVFVECTSSHISSSKGDFKRKLEDQILEKARKPYCNLQTALCVDITNIYCMRILESSMSSDDLSNYFKKVLMGTNFGSLLLFTYIGNLGKNTFGQSYLRMDNPKIDSSLKTFLDSCYPFGKETVNRCWIPHEG